MDGDDFDNDNNKKVADSTIVIAINPPTVAPLQNNRLMFPKFNLFMDIIFVVGKKVSSHCYISTVSLLLLPMPNHMKLN